MKNNIRTNNLRTIAALTCALSVDFMAIDNVNAQEAEATRLELEEIVVTATKREQTLQGIPVSVSVTSAKTIERSGILDIIDLQAVVPSLRIVEAVSSTATNFVIRGFGNGGISPGIEPSVGVFIDGIYRSRAAGAISDLPNLERVEVLRGPQSTLFGKNASAGVVSVVTQKPTGDSNGSVTATVGSDSRFVLKGFYEGSLSDSAAFSFAAGTHTRDGYSTNNLTGTDLNNRDRQSIRGQFLLSPSDSTEIRFIADYDTFEENCCAVVNLDAASPLLGALGGRQDAENPDSFDQFLNSDPASEVDNGGLSMHIDHELNNMTLTSITSFRSLDSANALDGDFTSADIFSVTDSLNADTFTQELRLTSNNDNDVNWMVGAFFFNEEIEGDNVLAFGQDIRTFADIATRGALSGLEAALGLPVGQSFFPAGVADAVEYKQDNQAISLFGQADWNISNALTATLGLNYTKDGKEAEVRQPQSDLFSRLDFVQIGFAGIFPQLTGGLPATPANISRFPAAAAQAQSLAQNPQVNALLGLQALQAFPSIVDIPNAVENGQSDDDEITYNLRLSYNINEDLMVYAGVSTGFKASSWNLTRDSRPFPQDFSALQTAGLVPANIGAGTRFASPEESQVMEIGLKANLHRGSLYLTAFDQTIEGFQSNAFLGTSFNLTNAGEVSVKGVELELTYNPTDALQWSFSGTYLDPIYDAYTGARDPVTRERVDLTGEQPAGFSEFSFSSSLNYDFNIGSLAAFVRAEYYYEDEVQVRDITPSTIASRDSRNVNMSLGFTTQNDFQVLLWARNLTDHASLIAAFPQPLIGGVNGYRTAPRSYGVTVSKSF